MTQFMRFFNSVPSVFKWPWIRLLSQFLGTPLHDHAPRAAKCTNPKSK